MIIKKILYELFKGTPLSSLYKKYCKDDDLKVMFKHHNNRISLVLIYLIYGYFNRIKISNRDNPLIWNDIEKIQKFLIKRKTQQKLNWLFYLYCHQQFFYFLKKKHISRQIIIFINEKYPNIVNYYDYLKFCLTKSYPFEYLFLKAFSWYKLDKMTYNKYYNLKGDFYQQIINFLIK